MDQTDHLDELIATVIAASVDAPMHFYQVDLCSSRAAKDIEELVAKDIASVDEDSDPVGKTPQQILKIRLAKWYSEFYNMIVDTVRDEVLAEIKDTIKTELRMELFTELQSLTENLPKGKPTPKVPSVRDFGAGALPAFDADLTGASVRTPVGGYDSIAHQFQFGGNRVNNRNNTAEESLLNNPLFARVNKSIERSKKGEAAYTTNELIEIRKQRGMSEKDEENMRARMEMSSFELEDEDPEVSEKFDKLFREKYGS